MREFEFRAWDTVNQVMEYNVHHLDSLNEILHKEKYKVMQWTGLYDRNNKKIYEGDLLRYPAKDEWEKESYSCFEVFFHSGDAHADYNIGYTMCRMHNHGSVCGGHIPAFKPRITCLMEVIGNVFENPELLKI